uniref:Uncharacterized protein n=1 Tax=Candidatus Kentrum sp. LFY TaxID=2126342 RepID=A0A450UFY0_9GAMM|nr:MAG: hypothetical protein BECKLFY1418A_GA0070994_101531 [Candidatus Kentron sp. LFY]
MKKHLHRICCELDSWFKRLKVDLKKPGFAITFLLSVFSVLLGLGYIAGILVVLFLVAILLFGFFALPYLLRVLAPPIRPEPDEQSVLAFSYIENKFAYSECLREQEAIDALNDKGIDDERAEQILDRLIESDRLQRRADGRICLPNCLEITHE